jgi:hypothetical protein
MAPLPDEWNVGGHVVLIFPELAAKPRSQQTILNPDTNFRTADENHYCNEQQWKRRDHETSTQQ